MKNRHKTLKDEKNNTFILEFYSSKDVFKNKRTWLDKNKKPNTFENVLSKLCYKIS